MEDEEEIVTHIIIPSNVGWRVAIFEKNDGKTKVYYDTIVAWHVDVVIYNQKGKAWYHRRLHHGLTPITLGGSWWDYHGVYAIVTPDRVYDFPELCECQGEDAALAEAERQLDS